MISLGPIFAIMLSRSHDCKNRPEGDHNWSSRALPCVQTTTLLMSERGCDTLIHSYIDTLAVWTMERSL